MKYLPNVLRLVVIHPAEGFEPRLESKGGPQVGAVTAKGDIVFETPYVCKQEVEGPAFHQEAGGRWSVYVGWYDVVGKRRGRLKVPLDAVPYLAWDCEVQVLGRDEEGEPSRGVANVVTARNIEDYLP